MNIFLLDEDQRKCAQAHCDKHCVKMVLETAQILCSAFPQGEAPYRQTHVNHPCCKFARKSRENYKWLLKLGRELAREYTHRYGKTHKSLSVVKWCEKNIDKLDFEQQEMTGFAQAMPDDYIHPDPVHAYRSYYIGEKKSIAKWEKSRGKPDWFPA